MGHYSYPLNDERQRLLDRLEEQTDASTRADALDAAVRHFLQDKQNREEHWDKFPPELLRLLNTDELSTSYYPKVR